jgi:ABC-type nitrate/sulfonate/bicarbonate transport system substrate-binding protein
MIALQDQRMKKHLAVAVVALAILAVSVVGIWYFASPSPTYSGQPEPVTVAYSPYELGTLFWVAEDQHYFENNGLNITTKKYFSGAASLNGVIDGEADITVGVAEFPFVTKVFENTGVRTLGTIDKSDIVYLIARKDRIATVSDIRGKKIGTARGTSAEFYLGRFLILHGLKMQDITLVDVKTPDEWVNDVASGTIDAMVIGQPYANAARDRLGDNALFVPAQANQPLFALVLSTGTWIEKHPGASKKFLKSLAQAEDFIRAHPAEAKDIIEKRVNLDPGYMDIAWDRNEFSLTLDQSLVAAMEDEARWLIENNLTKGKTVPDFRKFLDTKDLEEIKPGSVWIIE